MKIQKYDLRYVKPPLFAYFSMSEREIKPKVFTDGFSYEFIPFNEFHKITARFGYSTMIFKDGYRKKSNVTGYGNVWIFDIDSKEGSISYTETELVNHVKGLEALIVTTRSHTKEYPRFRLILLADEVITQKLDDELYKEMMNVISDGLELDVKKLDTACFSNDRQYAPNRKNQIHSYTHGALLQIKKVIEVAKDRLRVKKLKSVPAVPRPERHNKVVSDFTMKRKFARENASFETTKDFLESRLNLTVQTDGRVKIPGIKTNAICIDKKTGLVRDFAKEVSYDLVSILHDIYHVPLTQAVVEVYERMTA